METNFVRKEPYRVQRLTGPMISKPRVASSNAGFTLVEMVVAASIFAVISLASYMTISQVLDAREAINAKQAQMTSLQRTHALLKNDLRYALNRSVRNEFGDRENSFLVNEGSELFRLTTLYPAPKQSGKMKRIVWELADDELWRNEFTALDRASDETKVQRRIAGGIAQITLYYYVLEEESVQKKTEWDNADSIPLAFEVELELTNKQRYRWLFGSATL